MFAEFLHSLQKKSKLFSLSLACFNSICQINYEKMKYCNSAHVDILFNTQNLKMFFYFFFFYLLEKRKYLIYNRIPALVRKNVHFLESNCRSYPVRCILINLIYPTTKTIINVPSQKAFILLFFVSWITADCLKYACLTILFLVSSSLFPRWWYLVPHTCIALCTVVL